MKYQAIYRDKGGSVELHNLHCREWSREDFGGDETFDAPHHWAAAVEAWSHDTAPEFLACSEFTQFMECLKPGWSPNGRRKARRTVVPFNIEDDTAAEIITALYGRTLTWINSQSGNEESASLYPEGPRPVRRHGALVDTYPHHYTEVRHAPDGSRQILFIDSGKGRRDGSTGFRAVRLDSIVSVK